MSLCGANTLKIGDSLFQHKRIHKLTWRSPDNAAVTQIDHVCICKRWTSSLRDVRVIRGADVGSVAMLQLKLKKWRMDKKSYSNREVPGQRNADQITFSNAPVFYRTRLMNVWNTDGQTG